MPDFSMDAQRGMIERLTQLVSDRVRGSSSALASFQTHESTLHEQYAAERQRLSASQLAARNEQQAQYTSALTRVANDFEATVEAAMQEQQQAVRSANSAAELAISKESEEWEATRRRWTSSYEADVRELARGLQEFKERLEQHRGELRKLEEEAQKVARRRYCLRSAMAGSLPVGKCEMSNPIGSYSDALARGESALQAMAAHKLPSFLFTLIVLMFPVFVVTVAMLVAGFLAEPVAHGAPTADAGAGWLRSPDQAYFAFAAAGSIVLGVMSIVFVIVRPQVVHHTREAFRTCLGFVADGHVSLDAAGKLRAAEADVKKLSLKQQLQERLRKLDTEHKETIDRIASERESQVQAAAALLQQQRKVAADARTARQRAINEQYTQQSQQLMALQSAQTVRLEQQEQQELTASRELFERTWARLASHWKEGVAEVQARLDELWHYCRERFPDWYATDWAIWSPPTASLPALQLGTSTFRLDMLEHGIPDEDDLRAVPTEFPFPAGLEFSSRPALLLETWDEGRQAASRAMQQVMLRLLTSLPPGKVRFTIIDPLGLGQNFSAFMHLADFDEKLVNHRIWTEPGHINQRLADLTEHMEDVIQTYLRNEFPTIEAYNRQAGEVAEPFHVLVVANFPAGFNDESAQRLLSIVQSGARCGVYTLMSTDAKLEWPRTIDSSDLASHAVTLQWNGRRFCWADEVLKSLPLQLDEPPADERMTQIIRCLGQRAKAASRVEVPFSTVAPSADAWWAGDSRQSIEVGLGRAGASKLQYLRLGQGTSQHVLISGKTGSGKSTLLHALITNTAIHYGPDEVEFYLIDFKKGVEFKPYAAHRLPHARVVAIESEREFGMSVLERLDHELRLRGDRFRDAGVHDIRGFRDAFPDARMPRVLLVIDEFQEFFTQDDRLSQDAALLLDRLVRQGRAFGIHVLLGSQTLAGAYSLARSTIGQMAVRIALQCSEADSHLILSEDNTAARLLERPGEAIYNDANGLFEGNHPFQVVWLGAHEQEALLAQLDTKFQAAAADNGVPPLIVFEGNAPADLADNAPLRVLLDPAESVASGARLPQVWLGAAVAIKEPTSALFRRQSGANLLVVGQQEESAIGIGCSSLVSLHASTASGTLDARARIWFCDGTRPDSPEAGWSERFVGRLPWPVSLVTPTEAPARIQEIAQEVARRIEAQDEGEPPWFLFLFNLARFRDLRRTDDDFGFSSLDGDKPPSAGKLLGNILRDGPQVGVHTLVWADTFNTVNRWFDRSTLREFDLRALLQMSANDSSNLMDSPAASRLGQNRGLLYSEEQGTSEKFRPYGPPSEAWLERLRQQIRLTNAMP